MLVKKVMHFSSFATLEVETDLMLFILWVAAELVPNLGVSIL
jgi:hypothetical protein